MKCKVYDVCDIVSVRINNIVRLLFRKDTLSIVFREVGAHPLDKEAFQILMDKYKLEGSAEIIWKDYEIKVNKGGVVIIGSDIDLFLDRKVKSIYWLKDDFNIDLVL